jgi:hypothetical protein
LARTIYIRCIYGIFGREIIKATVIYGVYTRFWPTLYIITSAVGLCRGKILRRRVLLREQFQRQGMACSAQLGCATSAGEQQKNRHAQITIIRATLKQRLGLGQLGEDLKKGLLYL